MSHIPSSFNVSIIIDVLGGNTEQERVALDILEWEVTCDLP